MANRRDKILVTGENFRHYDKVAIDKACSFSGYKELSEACANGNLKAMLELAFLFRSLPDRNEEDRLAAANFWELRYHRITRDYESWLSEWFISHPDQEYYSTLFAPDLTGVYRGWLFRYAGIPGWGDLGKYYIEKTSDGILLVDEKIQEDRDEDGFGWETTYIRTICDINMNPISGLPRFIVYDDDVYDQEEFKRAMRKAVSRAGVYSL